MILVYGSKERIHNVIKGMTWKQKQEADCGEQPCRAGGTMPTPHFFLLLSWMSLQLFPCSQSHWLSVPFGTGNTVICLFDLALIEISQLLRNLKSWEWATL